MEDYLTEVRKYATALRTAGVTVPDELLVVATLQGLGNGYGSFTAVAIHQKERLGFDEIQVQLTDEARRLESREDRGVEAAMIAREKGKKSTRCWGCGKKGHFRDECPERPSSDSESSEVPAKHDGKKDRKKEKKKERANMMIGRLSSRSDQETVW
jgi:hypothetical protein